MNFSDIHLKPATDSRFKELHSYWHPNEQFPSDAIDRAEIVSPLSYIGYEEALDLFMQNPLGDKVSVRRENFTWRRYVKSTMHPAEILEIIDLAKGLRSKRNHLEFYFRDPAYSRSGDLLPHIVLSLSPQDGWLVARSAMFDTRFIDNFTWLEKPSIQGPSGHALWHP